MQPTLFKLPEPPPPAWTKEPTPKGLEKFGAWRHVSGWIVQHCGHPTANWPYSLIAPDRNETIVSYNGRGFKSAAIGRAVVEGIIAGVIRVTTANCVRGIACTDRIDANGNEVITAYVKGDRH